MLIVMSMSVIDFWVSYISDCNDQCSCEVSVEGIAWLCHTIQTFGTVSSFLFVHVFKKMVILHFFCYSDSEKNRCWMRCTLYFDVPIVHHGRPIAYKYIVFSQSRKEANAYEYFHEFSRRAGNTNRCLKVPVDVSRSRGKFSAYFACWV